MLISVLRELRVEADDGSAIPVAGARLQRLLVRLAVDAGHVISTDELTDTIWPDEPPADPTGALQALVSRLRRAIGPVIEQSGAGYRLEVPAGTVDVHRFDDLRRTGGYAGALALLDGPPLPLVGDQPWALPLVARIEQQALDAQEQVIEQRLDAGDLDGLTAQLRDLVTAYPLHEAFTGQLMRALKVQGHDAEALLAYERARRTLADTLGTDPAPALQALHQQLLRGQEAPRGSVLRAGLTSFLGRDRDLARLAIALKEHRLVTLVGPGGAGKTRLATEAGIAWRGATRAPVWLVELAPVSDQAAVLSTFVAALDLQTSRVFERLRDSGRPVDDWSLLIAELSTAPSLLIVDNCEHLLDPVAAVIDRLLLTVPDLRILATSREPLAVDGEQVRPVPPLGDDPGTRLFLDRAASAGAPVDEQDRRAVAEIVRRLDGLPLAIELAAARVRTLPVPVIAERLSDRFALLTGGRRTALPRHRTLFAVVAWSWDLLDDPERDVLQRFSVFAGGADATAVAAVTGRDDTDLVLASLVDKSLLVVDRAAGGLRYRMLETIREFSSDRLGQAGLAAQVRQAHARWVLHQARTEDARLRGPEQVTALHRLDAEADNQLTALRFLSDNAQAQAAVDLMLALSWEITVLDDDTRMRTMTGIALGTEGEVRPADRALVEILHINAGIATGVLDLPEGRRQLRRACAVVDADPAVYQRLPYALLLMLRSTLWADLPDLTGAIQARAAESGDAWLRAATLQVLIDVAENLGDVPAVRAGVAELATLVGPLGDRWLTATLLMRRSQLQTLDGHPADALRSLQEAEQLIEALGSTGDAMYLAMRTMDIHLRLGDFDAARAAVASAPEQWFDFVGAAVPLSFLVTIAVAEGDPRRLAEARQTLDSAADRLPVPGFREHATAIAGAARGLLNAEEGDLPAAVNELRLAFPAAVLTSDMPIVAGYVVAAADALILAGRRETAAECLGMAATIRGADDPGDPVVAVLTRRLRAALGEGFDAAYAKGRSKDRADAIADVDPAVLFPG